MKFDLNSILSIVGIIGYFICFFILRQTIKSKNSVIEDLKVLMDTTDIKRLAEYQKHLDELRQKEIGLVVYQETRKFIEGFNKDTERQYNEMATFIAELLFVLPKESADHIIKKDFPSCKAMFTGVLNHQEQKAGNSAQTD